MIHTVIDAIGIVGIVMLAAGLWLVSPVWMLTVVGSMFIAMALLAESGTLTIRFKKKSGS